MGRLDPAASPRMAGDAMALDDAEQDVGCRLGEGCGAGADLSTQEICEIVGRIFGTRNDLPAIATGGAPARLAGFEQKHVLPQLGQMEGCRERSEERRVGKECRARWS